MNSKFLPFIFFFFFFIFFENISLSQNIFLKGNYVEIGIHPCGSFGSDIAAPSGYHQNLGRLGFVCDYQKDGWDNGNPVFMGDYFVPGTPEEGWGIEWNIGIESRNFYNFGLMNLFDIPAICSYNASNSNEQVAVWKGEAIYGNERLLIQQTVRLKNDDLFFTIEVMLTNTGTETLESVEYYRNVDPDNEQPHTGYWVTYNYVTHQPGVGGNPDTAIVIAEGKIYRAPLILGTIDSCARVSTEGFSNRDPDDIYDTPLTPTQTNPTLADEAIALAYRFGDITPGECVTFIYYYGLEHADLEDVFLPLEPYFIYKEGCQDFEVIFIDSTTGIGSGFIIAKMWDLDNDGIFESVGDTVYYTYPSAGTYPVSLMVELCDGTTDTITIDIIADTVELLTVDLSAYSNICSGSEIDAGSGFAQYEWSNGEETQTITIDSSGNYSVTVTDYNGCTATDNINISLFSIPEITYTSQNATSIGGNEGSIALTVTNGTPPYFYNWSNGETTEDLDSITAGCYCVTVTDQNNCTVTENICITGPIDCTTDINGIPELEWVRQAGGTSWDEGMAISTDSSGNSYVTGFFYGTATFDSIIINSAGGKDIFITKYNTYGNVLWAKRYGGINNDIGYGISTDIYGNCYVTGYITITDSMFTNKEIFISKYNSNGDLQWVRQPWGLSGDDKGYAISTDNYGNCYVTGYFENTIYFDTTSITSAGDYDIFITKYNTNGDLQWVKQAGGTNVDFGYGISTDNFGNFYVTGYFQGTATFDSTSITSSGNNDIFIAKYNTNGDFQWVKQAGGTTWDAGYGISTDNTDNCYITGYFSGTATFDSTSITSAGYYDIFIAKYNTDGDLQWVKQAGGTAWANGYGISTDNYGNSYTTGLFADTVTFDTISIISIDSCDIFVAKYNTNGDFQWVKQAWSTTVWSGNVGYGISNDNAGNCYVTGYFQNTAYFDSTSITSSGSDDIFVAKYSDKYFKIKEMNIIGIDCNPDSICIALELEGGFQPFNYNWSNGETTEDICNLTPGDYSVVVTDANDCLVDSTVTIDVPEPLNLYITGTNVSYAGGSNGSADLMVNGGTPSYTYEWSNGATTEDLDNLTIGNYFVTVTDAFGCEAISNVIITEPDVPIQPELSAAHISCDSIDDGAIDLTVTGGTTPYTYSWSNSETTEDISNLAAGWYSVTITDNSAPPYIAIDSVEILEDEFPVVNLGNDTIICNGGYIVLDAGNEGSTYSWSTGTYTQTISVNSTGTYIVSVTNTCGTVSDTINVTIDNTPLSLDLGNDTILCSYDSIVLDAGNPGAIYLWSTGDNTQTITVNTTGIFSVSVMNCSDTVTDSVTIIIIDTIQVNLGNDTTLCQGETLLLDITTPYTTYLWQDNSTNPNFTVDLQGTYWVEVTDTNNCSASDTINVSYFPLTSIDLGNDTSICQGETLILDAGTGYISYFWQDGTTNQTLTADTSGNYRVEVTDTNGCKETDTLNITIIELPTVNLGPDTSYCESDTITLNAGAGDFYLWNDSSTAQTLDVTATGTYAVTVTTAGCEGTDEIYIIFNPLPVVNLGADTSACEGETVILDAGAGYIYEWSDGSTNQKLYVTETGIYTVTVTDICGFARDTIEIIINPLPAVDLGPDTSMYSDSTLILEANNPGANYIWSTGETTQTIIVTEQGTYSVTVTDNNGCSNTAEIKITVKEPEKPEIIIYNVFTPNDDNINDTWSIKNIEFYKDSYIEVCNRNGNLVFSAENYQNDWDGKYNNKELPAATYYYIIDLGDGSDVFKGGVAIVR